VRALGLLLLLALLAGCVQTVAPAARVEEHAFLASDMTLAAAPEATEHAVPAGSFFAAWAQGQDYPTWREAPTGAGRLVENASLHLRVRATGPVARTFRFPDILAYGGSGEAWMGLGNATTPPVLTPGTTYVFDVDLALPKGGLWVPADQTLGVKVVPVMHQNDAADVDIIMGGDDPSALRWRASPAVASVATTLDGHVTGDVEGSAYAGAATPPTAQKLATLRVPPDGTLLAWMNVTDAQGIPDVDLGVVAPDGSTLAYSGTPTGREMVRLGPANLHGVASDLALQVTDYGSARATYTLEWRAG
jgi:hypothetical protein